MVQACHFLSLAFPSQPNWPYFLPCSGPPLLHIATNQVIVLMISATSCWVKWREVLVRVWIDGRYRHTDRQHVLAMENGGLNRLWLSRCWLKFHFRQEDNYSLFPDVEVQLCLDSTPRVYSFLSFLFCGRINTFLLLSFWCLHLYIYIWPDHIYYLFFFLPNEEDSRARHVTVEIWLSSCFRTLLKLGLGDYCGAAMKYMWTQGRHFY